jgi:cell division protein FtsB
VRRSTWLALASAVALAGVLFLFVFPTSSLLAQRRERSSVASELRRLTAENRLLDERVKRLHTPEEVERLARERFYLVRPGEEAFAIQPPPAPAVVPREVDDATNASSRARGLWERVWARVGALL